MTLAFGEGDPAKVVASWLERPEDRDALLSAFDRAGVGVATDSEGIPYWVILLAQSSGTLSVERRRWSPGGCEICSGRWRKRLAQRRHGPELMDQPGLDASDHCRRAARAGADQSAEPERLDPLAGDRGAAAQPSRPARYGSWISRRGEGTCRSTWRSVPREAVWTSGSRAATSVRSPSNSRPARRERRAFPSASLDSTAVDEPLPEYFDVVTCSLFLHHLAEDEAVRLLARMAGRGTHDDPGQRPAPLAVWLLAGVRPAAAC